MNMIKNMDFIRKKSIWFALAFLVFCGCKNKEVRIEGETDITVIPQPKSVKISSNGIDVRQIKGVVAPPDWKELEHLFSGFQKKNQLQLTENEYTHPVEIKKEAHLQNEAYKVNITSESIEILASNYAGAFNGLQTLQQLILNAVNGVVPQVTIEDQPRFGYRGLMIDCSRHFWTVNQLKETIAQMAFYKLNKLHLHLTDNNAWRVEIKAYPDLITKGTYYKDFPELSNKFYTQDDLKEVVRFAKKHNIEVIPEIDMPGHAIGILAAYPEFACTLANKTFEVYPEEMPLDNRIPQASMLCLGNPDVYEFAERVVKELSEVFPSNKIHLGGDEVPTNIWKTCKKCQNTHKEKGLKEWGELQDQFTKKMSAIAQKYDKTMLGWDEINERHAATPNDVVMVWRNYGYPQAIEALERDVPVIMAPQHGCYYDWGYAGNSTRKVYEWNPISEDMEGLNKNNLVIGGQACLWTERVPTQDHLEYMLYPRLTALAEVLWTPKEKRNWQGYLQRLEAHYPVMEAMDINYYVDDAINDKEFVPTSEKPALVRHAQLSSNVPNHRNYHLEYIFDGRNNTFYWGGRALKKDDWYQVTLGEPVKAKKVTILSGDAKDYINYADVLISEDGEKFTKVATFDEYGEANAKLNTTIKAIRIEVTKAQTNWPILKEIVIR